MSYVRIVHYISLLCVIYIMYCSVNYQKLLGEGAQPCDDIGGSLNNSHFDLLLWEGCFEFQIWFYSKHCEQMIIDFHQLSHYYDIYVLQLITN